MDMKNVRIYILKEKQNKVWVNTWVTAFPNEAREWRNEVPTKRDYEIVSVWMPFHIWDESSWLE